MNNCMQSNSSLHLLSLIGDDLESLLDNPHNHWELTADNIVPMLDIIDELKGRIELEPESEEKGR